MTNPLDRATALVLRLLARAVLDRSIALLGDAHGYDAWRVAHEAWAKLQQIALALLVEADAVEAGR